MKRNIATMDFPDNAEDYEDNKQYDGQDRLEDEFGDYHEHEEEDDDEEYNINRNIYPDNFDNVANKSEMSIHLDDIYQSEQTNVEYVPSLELTAEDFDALYHQVLFRKQRTAVLEVYTRTKSGYELAIAFLMAVYCSTIVCRKRKRAQELGKRVFAWLINNSIGDASAPQSVVKYVNYLLGVYYTNHLNPDAHEEELGIVYFQQAVEMGYHPALCSLGVCHIKGNGVPRDYRKAVDYFHRCADQYQYAPAQHNLAICYQKGIGVNKDLAKAIHYERLSAEQGFINAVHTLATCFERSDCGVLQDFEEACRLHRLAAEYGHLQSAMIVAGYYEKGRGVKKDLKEAFHWYWKCAHTGVDAEGNGDPDEGSNHPTAQYKLAYFYEHGYGVEVNYEAAFEWCLKSAMNGDYLAQNVVGSYYEKGIGTEINPTEAIRWYKASARQGYSSAQYNLGRYYINQYIHNVHNMNEDHPDQAITTTSQELLLEGIQWHRLCANQGEMAALKSLLHLYKQHLGITTFPNGFMLPSPQEIKRLKKFYHRQKEYQQRLKKASSAALTLKDIYLSEEQYREDLPNYNNNKVDRTMDPLPKSSFLYVTVMSKVLRRRSILDQQVYAIHHIPMTIYLKLQRKHLPTFTAGVSDPAKSSYTIASSFQSTSISLLQNLDTLQREIDHLIQLSQCHPHVQQYYQSYFLKSHHRHLKYLLVVTEFLSDPSSNTIATRIPHSREISPDYKTLWLIQCCHALQFLHQHQIYHYHLTPESLFLSQETCLKIGNFIPESLIFPNATANTSDNQIKRRDKSLALMLSSSVGKRIFQYQSQHHYVAIEKIQAAKQSLQGSGSLLFGPKKEAVKGVEEAAAESEYDFGKEEVWILGCIFLELLRGQRLKESIEGPFYDFVHQSSHQQVKESLLESLAHHHIEAMPILHTFLQCALLETAQRPSFFTLYQDILKPHEFFEQQLQKQQSASTASLPLDAKFIEEEENPRLLPVSPDSRDDSDNRGMIVPITPVTLLEATTVTFTVLPEGYTAEMISDLYEMIRLNKVKLKKLEKLAKRSRSLLAMGFLMVLYACDLIHYQREKAIRIGKELYPWLLEEERRSNPQVAISGDSHHPYDEDQLIDTMNDYAEYITFFLGVYYSQQLFVWEVEEEEVGAERRESESLLPLPPPPPPTQEETQVDQSLKNASPLIKRESALLPRKKHKHRRKSADRQQQKQQEPRPTLSSAERIKEVMASALPYFLQSIENGYLTAQNNVGVCYALGLGVEQSFTDAVTWFRLSANDGNELGQYNLGLCYEYGYGVVRKDMIEATRLYTLSAEQGCAMARCKLGECYEHGKGLPISFSEALQWYRLSADQGLAKGQYHLGLFFEKGKAVVAVDPENALKWYRLSAEQSYEPAQYALALCYERGFGADVNMEEAHRWYSVIAEGSSYDRKFITINSFLM